MVIAAKVILKDAETARKQLLEQGVIDFGYVPARDEKHLYIPLLHEVQEFLCVDYPCERKQEKTTDLRTALLEHIPEQDLERIKTAYDLVGDIAILEIDRELRQYETLIGKTLLTLQPAIAVVVRKDSGHEGELRLQNYVWLAGEKRFETTTIENGVRLTLDIRKTYYSVRSSTERMRIASLVAPDERVLIMFSGIGPFVCVLAKNTQAKEVVGVELNEEAHFYAEQNILLNKLRNAKVFQGDVREVVSTLGTFDRICMPLPHTAQDFLDVAVPACNKGAMIHLYHFSTEEEVEAFAKTIPSRLQELKRDGRVVHIQKCGNLAPGVHRWSIDIEVA